MKIKKRSDKLDGIGVGRIRTVPFPSDSANDSDAYDPVKTRLSESQAEVLGLFFGFHVRVRQPRLVVDELLFRNLYVL